MIKQAWDWIASVGLTDTILGVLCLIVAIVVMLLVHAWVDWRHGVVEMDDPFAMARLRRRAQRVEFEEFKKWALEEIKPLRKKTPGFETIAAHYSFTTTFSQDDTVQISFGKRKMDDRDLEGNTAIERGISLVYSFGTGAVATVLYPATSPLASTLEEMIYLRVGNYSATQLKAMLSGDVKDLVSYAYVSSIDTTPTSTQLRRIWWLRKRRPLTVKGNYVTPENAGTMVAKLSATALVVALMKPVAMLLVFALLLLLGYSELAHQAFWK